MKRTGVWTVTKPKKPIEIIFKLFCSGFNPALYFYGIFGESVI